VGPEQISRLEFGSPPPVSLVEDNFDQLKGWVPLSLSDLKRICHIMDQLNKDKPSVQEKVLTREELEKRELAAALGSALHFFRFLDTVRQQCCEPELLIGKDLTKAEAVGMTQGTIDVPRPGIDEVQSLLDNLPLTIPTHPLGVCERINSFFTGSPDFWAFNPKMEEKKGEETEEEKEEVKREVFEKFCQQRKEAAMALWERIRALAENEDPFIQGTMRLEGYYPGLEVEKILKKWQNPKVLERGIELINSSYDLGQVQYKYPELRVTVWLKELKISLFVILDEVIREGERVVVRDLKTGKEGILEVERALLQTIAALIAKRGDSFFAPGNKAQGLDLIKNRIKSIDFEKGRVEEIRPGDPHIRDLTLPGEVCRQEVYRLMEIIRKGKVYRVSGHLPKAASRRKRPQASLKRMF